VPRATAKKKIPVKKKTPARKKSHGGARVRAYLASLPPGSRGIIRKMREAVLAAVPAAVEEISYGFPVFKLEGEPVVWCAAWQKHTSIYPVTPAVRRALASEIDRYEVFSGTIRFPLTKPPSAAFVKRFAKARVAELRKAGKVI
jgi:uncharacterized protein YdhG (YjbR/CyaY superfamily)